MNPVARVALALPAALLLFALAAPAGAQGVPGLHGQEGAAQALLYYRLPFGAAAEREGYSLGLGILAEAGPATGLIARPQAVLDYRLHPGRGATLWVHGARLWSYHVLNADEEDGEPAAEGEEQPAERKRPELFELIDRTPAGVLIGIAFAGVLASGCC